MAKRFWIPLLVLSAVMPLAAVENPTVKAWPLVYHAIDEEAGAERLEIAWPLIDLRTAPRYDKWSLLHLFSRQTNTTAKETRTSALFDLLGWVSRDETRWRNWVAPLLWLGRAGGSSHAVVFPLYWRFLNGKSHVNAVFPVYYGSGNGNGSTQGYLFLVWRGERNVRRNAHLYRYTSNAVVPFYWASAKETDGELARKRQTLLPVFSRHEKHDHREMMDRDEWNRSAFFLVRWKRQEETNRTGKYKQTKRRWMVWPLVNRRTRSKAFTEDEHRRQTVVTRALGPIAKFTSRTLTEADGTPLRSAHKQRVFPFYFRGSRDYGTKSSHLVLFPFWWDFRKPGESTQALVPLGARIQDGDDKALNILGPLLTRIRSQSKDYTRYDALFPLLMLKTGKDTAAFRLWPLYAQHREDGKREGGSVCWPLVRWEERSDAKGARTYTPVFGNFSDMFGGSSSPTPSGKLTRSVWPFFVSKRSGSGWSWWSFPVGGASHHSTPNTSREAFHAGPLGLFYRHSTSADVDDSQPRTKSATLHGAWAREQGENISARRVAWLFSKEWRRRQLDPERVQESRETALMPLYRRRVDQQRAPGDPQLVSESVTTEIPFLLRAERETEWDLDGEHHGRALDVLPFPGLDSGLYHQRKWTDGSRELAILDPLWTVETTPSREQEATSLAGFAYRSERDICGFRERRLLYRVFRTEANSRRRTWELMPFADGMTSTRGERSFQFLGGLLGYESGPERTRFRFAYLPLFSKRHATEQLGDAELQKRAKQHLENGLEYLGSRTPERAIVELSLAEPAFGTDPALYEKLGDACALVCTRGFDQDFLEEAMQDIKSFSSNYPGSFQHKMAGRGGLQNEFRKRAFAAYEKTKALGGDSALLRRKLIRVSPEAGQAVKVQLLYKDAIDAFPRDLSLRLDFVGRQATKTGDKKGVARRQHRDELRALARDYPKSALLQHKLLTHTPAKGQQLRQLIEQALSAALLPDVPRYQPLYPGPNQQQEDNPRRCLDLALDKMTMLANHFHRQKNYTAELHWWQRSFETRLDWGIAPASEWRRRETIARIRRAHEKLKTEDELIPYLEKAIADLKPDTERVAWQREIRRLRREASYITSWQVEGPLPAAHFPTVDSWHLPEPRLLEGRLFDRYVNLRTALKPSDRAMARCGVTVASPKAREAMIVLGFDERLLVKLNGQEVFSGKSRIAVADEYRVPVALRAGENQLVLELQNRKLAWGFFLRIADTDGNPLEDLDIQAKPFIVEKTE